MGIRSVPWRTVAAAGTALACAAGLGCGPGDGSTLDERGRSYLHPYAPALGSRYGAADFPATFAGIQEGFFEPFCGECHAGAAPPKGLDLASAVTYELLVGAPSAERPSLALVEPFEPDRSYLILKLEGGPGIAGRQMPRGRAARPASEIDTIREWILAGAADDR